MTTSLVIASEMKEMEQWVSAHQKITELQMIEMAAQVVFQKIKNFYKTNQISTKKVCVFICGKGHNGADALLAALYAGKQGYAIEVFHVASSKGYSFETTEIKNRLTEEYFEIHSIHQETDFKLNKKAVLIVDGLLGSGLTRPALGLVAECIKKINKCNCPVLSVDIPSGLYTEGRKHTQFGEDFLKESPPVMATETISLGTKKLSSFFYPSATYYGKVTWNPLCFNVSERNAQPSQLKVFEIEDAKKYLPKRSRNSHKYTTGRVLVIAGSLGMHGAAVLASKAAMKSGAGMVKLAVPRGIHSAICHHTLEIISIPIGLEATSHFEAVHCEELLPLIEWADTVLLGPGLGRECMPFLPEIVPQINKPLVLDGDGLAYYAEASQPIRLGIDSILLTPHEGEFQKIAGKSAPTEGLERIEFLRKISQERHLNILLKGPTTIYGANTGEIILQTPGPSSLATAGTGDVLAGIITAFACHMSLGDAACLGVYVHKKAGGLAGEEKGTLGVLAGDVLEVIPKGILSVSL